VHYIINPWVFYLLYLAVSVKVICAPFLIFFTFAIAVYSFVYDETYCGDKYPSPGTLLRKFKIPLILSVVLIVFVPTSETVYKMMIASQVTTENIDTAKETIQDVADYIVDAVKEIKEKEDD
jgi:xanthine/uracil permease